MEKICIYKLVGTTKFHHVDCAVNAIYIQLSKEDIAYLEECYISHKLVGVMAQNTLENVKKEQVWSK